MKRIDTTELMDRLKKIVQSANIPLNGRIYRVDVPFSLDYLVYEERTRKGVEIKRHGIKKIFGIELVGDSEKLKIHTEKIKPVKGE